jgi:acyl CoA:acetate/3-ketoacid CoA transferase
MINPISGVTGNSTVEYTPTTFSQQTTAASDTAVLSVTSQAILLNQQGLNVSEIANLLGVSTGIIQNDLEIAITVPQTSAATA